MYKTANLAVFKKKLSSHEFLQSKTTEPRTKDTKNICFICGGSGQHKASECPTRTEGPKCFKCKQNDHISSFCPSNPIRRMNIIKKVVEEEEYNNEENEFDLSPEEKEKLIENFSSRFENYD